MIRNPTEAIVINIQERENEKMNLEAVYKRAVEFLDEERIDPSKDFKGLYSDEMIKKDSDYVEKRQQKFKADDTPEAIEMKKYATVFEAIIHDEIDMNGWMGMYATAKKASWYDDLKNGIDEIIEFEQTEISPSAHLALAVDITFSKDIYGKMNEIAARIESGDAGVIKYPNFES